MNLNNSSYQSLSRPPLHVVDVTDLREALGEFRLHPYQRPILLMVRDCAGGRSETLANSSPPSISSTNGARSVVEEMPKRRGMANHEVDATQVLKSIFDKKRGGSMRRVQNGAPAVAAKA